MKYIDLHCDTLMKMAEVNGEESLLDNRITSVDFKRMKESKAMAQFFAIFLLSNDMFKDTGREPIPDDQYILKLRKILLDEVDRNSDIISMAYNYDDLIENYNNGKMSAFLTIEDGRSVDGKLEKIEKYYNLGIRLIGLTWNYENCFGFPNSTDPNIMNKGLKDFGKESIEYMNDLGIIIDVSHLSDGGFYDVAKISKKPFIASHSNARILSNHPRNLTDDMIKLLAEQGGVAGLNFAPGFLNKDITSKESRIEFMVEHLNHMKNIGGEDILALGSDFDGISGNLEIDGSDKMPDLFKFLRKDGWTERLLEKLAYKNALRVIKEVNS
ncbi:MAG TPA: dipeptidase [Tissierellaceae bacterium]|nr:dipeptidase [Tissierellaceae bacterium]